MVDGEERLLERDSETGVINQLFRKTTAATRPHIDQQLLDRLWERGQKTEIGVSSRPIEFLSPEDHSQKGTVLHQIAVLLTAFEEVAEYDPGRHHNLPPPTLWLENKTYLRDLKALMAELRKLNDDIRDSKETKVARKTAGVVSAGIRKFVESYADVLGKGAAALTIGAAAVLLANIGVSKDVVDVIWGHLKPPKWHRVEW